jgi:hypothetical protein
VHIRQFESPPHLPTLDALDTEFGSFGEQCAAGRRRQRGTAMDSAFTTQSEFPRHLGGARQKVDAMTPSSREAVIMRSSLGRRASRSLARFLIVFFIGVGATLGWQSYGGAARAMIANSSPKLGWLAPQTASDNVVPVAAATASPDLQELAASLASVRQSVDQLAAQLAFGQRQMGDKIAKLQADEQEILQKFSAAPMRPSAPPPRKPAAVTPEPSPSVQAR